MIVITNPSSIKNEMQIIQHLFEEGLDFLHIRKPDFTVEETKHFLSKINPHFYSKIILHNHHSISKEFNLLGIHFSEKERYMNPTFKKDKFKITSTSVHKIEDFNNLNTLFSTAFLSPVYKSISKTNYFPNYNHLKEIKNRTNFQTKLIALGGIEAKNIKKTLDHGFDDVALLGTIWKSSNPLKKFLECQKNAHMF